LRIFDFGLLILDWGLLISDCGLTIRNPQSTMCLHTVTRVTRQELFNQNKA